MACSITKSSPSFPSPLQVDLLEILLDKEPWLTHVSLCSPLCTCRAGGIHRAGLQCGPQAQFSVDKTTKGEKKRRLRKSMDTMDKAGGSWNLGQYTLLSYSVKLISPSHGILVLHSGHLLEVKEQG